jgi:hypothetical protein
MQWSDLPLRPTTRTLRQFALLWIVFFSGAAAWQGLAQQRTLLGGTLAVLAWTVGPIGVCWPEAVRPIYVGWMIAAFPIGWLISRLVLGVLFYGLFTPLALVFRLAGRDRLALQPNPGSETYWSAKHQGDAQRYFRPY